MFSPLGLSPIVTVTFFPSLSPLARILIASGLVLLFILILIRSSNIYHGGY